MRSPRKRIVLILVAGSTLGFGMSPVSDEVSFAASCQKPKGGMTVYFDQQRYPHIIAHIKKSWKKGYPKVLKINRIGADTRRDKLLADIPTKPGYDRDEAPAASLRDTVKADVMYVESSENRSAGASLGQQISPYCDGTRVRYQFVKKTSDLPWA